MPPPKVTNADRKRLDATVSAFHTNYASTSNWGPERWENSLFPALSEPTRHAALVNRFASMETLQQNLRDAGIAADDLELLALPRLRPNEDPCIQCLVRTGEAQIGQHGRRVERVDFPPPNSVRAADTSQRLLTHWNMDAASALAAHMLDVQPGDRVLDLCAAPGGKSIALAQCIWPQGNASPLQVNRGCLHCNEFEPARNKRLAANIQAYLPQHLLQAKSVRLFRLDGTSLAERQRLPFGSGGYDRVLLDAPCSSERHLIHAQKKADASGHIAEELARWRPSSSKNLAKTQTALLWAALHAVKVGGRVVYATCSIESTENDGVVERLLAMMDKERKKADLHWGVQFETGKESLRDDLDAALDGLTEITKYGRIALPDHSSGGKWGPLFLSVITKIAAPTS